MRRTLTLIALLSLFYGSFASSAQVRRAMTPGDLLRMASVSDAQISPDGEWVVYAVSTTDRDATNTRLWIARVGRQTPTAATTRVSSAPLLSNDWNAANPRWSPDSRRIAFLSTREGQTGIYVVSLTERQPRLVAAVNQANFFIAYAGESFAWSPDSRRIAFISASEDEGDNGTTSASIPTKTDKANDPRVIDRIQYKTRTSFSDRARTHVWLVEVDAPAERNQPRQLTFGQFYDHALSWNPNGSEIAFLSNREPEPEANNNSDIYAVDVQGRLRQITETRGCEYEPAWSPDGSKIAFGSWRTGNNEIYIANSNGTNQTRLTNSLDVDFYPVWSPDGNKIAFIRRNNSAHWLYVINADGTNQTLLTPNWTVIGQLGWQAQ